ncbi:hypothetical protein GT23_0808 [Parageobacillus thermoglucosidasius]|nr:hypothetical protein GT23_0808 [Parageobacillus thermoglucosidasius]
MQKIYEELGWKAEHSLGQRSSKACGNGINTEPPVEQVSTGGIFLSPHVALC